MSNKMHPGWSLFAITSFVALVLALVSHVTAPEIARRTKQQQQQAVEEVLGARVIGNAATASYRPVGQTSVTKLERYQTEHGPAYVATAQPTGYNGPIVLLVGVAQGKVTGVRILETSETPGLGANVKRASFCRQYVGKGYKIGLRKQASLVGDIQAVTGATISSAAVTEGVNDALLLVEQMKGREPDE